MSDEIREDELTVGEVADLFGVSRATVRGLDAALQPRRVFHHGCMWRVYTARAVEAYAQKLTASREVVNLVRENTRRPS